MKEETKTKQQLLLEMEALRTRLDATVFYWKEIGTPSKYSELRKENGYGPGGRETNLFRHST